MSVTSTERLRDLLRERYRAPEWALAFEVQADRAEGGLRFADAIAVNTRKTSGMPVLGFELKVSRADLQHELRHPAKQDAAASRCDQWWLVVGSARLAEGLDLPPHWGVLAADAKGQALAVQRPAQRNPARDQHQVDRLLTAALLRRLLNEEARPESYWRAKLQMAREAGFQAGRNQGARLAGRRLRNLPSARDLDAPLALP